MPSRITILGLISLTIFLPKFVSAEEQLSGTPQKQGTSEDCQKITNQEKRLSCYDKMASDASDSGELLDKTSGEWFESNESALKTRLKQEFSNAYNKSFIIPHKPNYIMPFTYNDKASGDAYKPFTVFDENADNIDNQEVKYQLSLKVPLAERLFYDNVSVWFAYTQVAYWQLYNSDISAPFRETNYEPEVIALFQTDEPFLGMTLSGITLAFNHQSNGRSEPLSRSWNRIILGFHLQTENTLLSIKPWYRLPEDDEDDNNPDIEKYLGYADIVATYKDGDHNYNVLFRNNFETDNNRSSFELNWSFPISQRLNGIVQYMEGYGDGLIDYNHRSQRIGVGIMLTDWL